MPTSADLPHPLETSAPESPASGAPSYPPPPSPWPAPAYGQPYAYPGGYAPDPWAEQARLAALKNGVNTVYWLYIGGLLLGVLPLVGVILAHAKKAEARGTVYELHLDWQTRTFWITAGISLAMVVMGLLGVAVLAENDSGTLGTLGVVMFCGAILGYLGAGAWWLYRVIAGWMRLHAGRAP
jgi:uncharacterized membrane protein